MRSVLDDLHHHPCQFCGRKLPCDGTRSANPDGWPEVVCATFHLASGEVSSKFLCAACDEAERRTSATSTSHLWSDTLFDRIAKKIRKDRTTGCWIWLGAYSTKRQWQRRPVIQLGKLGTPIASVARTMLERSAGPAPSPDHEAGHTCPAGENMKCVNPRHLRWMTRLENEQSKQRDRGGT